MAGQPQDIYPLGQQGGLLKDILNFALNNLYQYGKKTEAANQERARLFADLKGGRSNPQAMRGLMDEAMNINPVMGKIQPGGWAAHSPEAKAMLNNFADAFPETFRRVLKSPQDLLSAVTDKLPPQAAAMLSKHGDTHILRARPNYAPELATVGHEIQHHLNADRVAKTNPLDALTIGTLLREHIPTGYRGSLNTVLDKAIAPPKGFHEKLSGPFKELMQFFTGSNPALNKLEPLRLAPTADRNLMRAAMDEAFAYTAQNAATNPNASPLLRELAKNLDLQWK